MEGRALGEVLHQVPPLTHHSRRCGTGERRRDVQCVDEETGEGVGRGCRGDPPATTSACMEPCQEGEVVLLGEQGEDRRAGTYKVEKPRQPGDPRVVGRGGREGRGKVPRYRWKIGQWRTCSQPCGGGQHTR